MATNPLRPRVRADRLLLSKRTHAENNCRPVLFGRSYTRLRPEGNKQAPVEDLSSLYFPQGEYLQQTFNQYTKFLICVLFLSLIKPRVWNRLSPYEAFDRKQLNCRATKPESCESLNVLWSHNKSIWWTRGKGLPTGQVFSSSPQPCGSAGQACGHVFSTGGGGHAWNENRPSAEPAWTGPIDNIYRATVG